MSAARKPRGTPGDRAGQAPRRAPRPARRGPRLSRSDVLRAAAGLLLEHGIAGVDGKAIAAAAGLRSTSGLYPHFPERRCGRDIAETVVRATLERGWDLVARHVAAGDNALTQREREDPVQRAHVIVQAFLSAWRSGGPARDLILLTAGHPASAASGPAFSGETEIRRRLDDLFAAGREGGTLRPHIPAAAFRQAFLGALFGLTASLARARPGGGAGGGTRDPFDVDDVDAAMGRVVAGFTLTNQAW